MVDKDVRFEIKTIVGDLFPGVPDEVVDYLFKCRVLDVNKCRIAVIKRYYRELISQGKTATEAKGLTAVKFYKSEKTIENLIYNTFYKDITI